MQSFLYLSLGKLFMWSRNPKKSCICQQRSLDTCGVKDPALLSIFVVLHWELQFSSKRFFSSTQQTNSCYYPSVQGWIFLIRLFWFMSHFYGSSQRFSHCVVHSSYSQQMIVPKSYYECGRPKYLNMDYLRNRSGGRQQSNQDLFRKLTPPVRGRGGSHIAMGTPLSEEMIEGFLKQLVIGLGVIIFGQT